MNDVNLIRHDAMKELLSDERLTGIAKTVSQQDYFITMIGNDNYGIVIIDFEMPMTTDKLQFYNHSQELYQQATKVPRWYEC